MNATLKQMAWDPHSGWSAISFPCAVTSAGERCAISCGCVLIHPRGSRSLSRKSSFGNCAGSSTPLLLPRCGGQAIAYEIVRTGTILGGSKLTDLNLLDLLIVWRGYTIQRAGDLGAQVGVDDERGKNIVRQNVGEGREVVLYLVVGEVDVLESQCQVRR